MKTFGIIIGVTISLGIAMFIGLYMLGTSGQGHINQISNYNYDIFI